MEIYEMLYTDVSRCANELIKFCTSFQKRREEVTDQLLDQFMTPRPLLCRGVLSNTIADDGRSNQQSKGPVKDPGSKTQAKKMEKLRLAEAKKEQKRLEKEANAKVVLADRNKKE